MNKELEHTEPVPGFVLLKTPVEFEARGPRSSVPEYKDNGSVMKNWEKKANEKMRRHVMRLTPFGLEDVPNTVVVFVDAGNDAAAVKKHKGRSDIGFRKGLMKILTGIRTLHVLEQEECIRG